jgi:hypothetical protein
MKRILVLLMLVGVLFIAPVQGATTANNSIMSGAVSLKTVFVSQDPYPAEPNAYVNLLFKLENWGTTKAENVVFELVPEYPFSLDPGANATIEIGTVNGLQTDTNALLLRYKVKVDKDAVKGENEIGIKYGFGDGSTFYVKTFNVSVSNPQTDFDVVMQGTTSGSTTLAIANVGSNTAYSVIVTIPSQPSFTTQGVSSSIVGNLNAGDYTLASFQIVSTSAFNQSTAGRAAFNRSALQGGNSLNRSVSIPGNLLVQISYTDTLGIRRTVQKDVNVGSLATGTLSSQFSTTGRSSTQLSDGLTYIAIGVVGIVAVVLFFKLRGRRKK